MLIGGFDLASEVIDHTASPLDTNNSGLLHLCRTAIVKLDGAHFHILIHFYLQYITFAPRILGGMSYVLRSILVFRHDVLCEVRNFTSITDAVDVFVHIDALNWLKSFDPVLLRYDFIILH